MPLSEEARKLIKVHDAHILSRLRDEAAQHYKAALEAAKETVERAELLLGKPERLEAEDRLDAWLAGEVQKATEAATFNTHFLEECRRAWEELDEAVRFVDRGRLSRVIRRPA